MIPKQLDNQSLEAIYDLIAESIDKAPEHARMLFLAKLSLALANYVGDKAKVEQAAQAALRDL